MSAFDLGYAVWLFFRALFIGLVFVFLISGLDDLFMDTAHYLRVLYRRLFRRKYIRPLTREQLAAAPEQPIAIMIPAWDESSIIQRMLLNTAGAFDYKNFHVFVGTYPNDPATAQEAAKAREVYPNIEIIVTPNPGPTNKADCLNWIAQGIHVFEKTHGIQFAAYVMQDAEDIVHPLWLKMINHLVPQMDFIQLPVFPLETTWHDWVGGVYRDEFAENHTKDMRARELLSDALPSAGVGTALSRKTIEWMAAQRDNQLFDITSLTEDYLMGIFLSKMPGRKIFLQQWVSFHQTRKGWFSGRERPVTARQLMATREFFPDTFRAAVRQKSRWILGISLQGWRAGWTRSLGNNYFLFRDRKALLTNLAVMLGYAVALYWAGILLHNQLRPENIIPPLVESHEMVNRFALVVVGLFAWRIANRIGSTTLIYGPLEGLLAVPRLLVGNFINFYATVMAIQRFVNHKLTGTVPAWGKTAHAWPSEDLLQKYRRKLGDLLLDQHLVTPEQLTAALRIQQEKGGRLGDILVTMGVLCEENVVSALAVQENTKAVEIDPYAHLELLDLVPLDIAQKHRVFPVGREGETLVLAREAGRTEPSEKELAALLGRPVTFHLATGADIQFAIERGYSMQGVALLPHARLGERLLREGKLTAETLTEVLRRQKRSRQRLGDILVEMNLLTPEQLETHLQQGES